MMIKKFFALASVTALTGVVAATMATGCTTETTVEEPADTDAGTKEKDGGKVNPDAGDDDGDDEPTSCAATKEIDPAGFPYKPARVVAGACTEAEVGKIAAWFGDNSNGDISIAEWSKEVSDDCAACVFTPTSGDKWGPLLTEGDEFDGSNRGGCIEIQSGNEACGKAYQHFYDCYFATCLPTGQGGFSTCKTQEEFDACLDDTDAIVNACSGVISGLQQACGNKLDAYEKACQGPKGAKYIFEGTIPAHCIGADDVP